MVEIISSLFGLIQGILILFKKKENWIFYLLNIGTLTVYSFTVHLYGDVIENGFYLFFGILGLLTWYNKQVASMTKNHNTIKYCTNTERLIIVGLFVAISTIVYAIISQTSDPTPFLDAITTGMGFTATLLMVFKKVESWIIWFVDDIIMAYIYFSLPNTGFWLGTLNVAWVVMAIFTFIIWHKAAMKQRS